MVQYSGCNLEHFAGGWAKYSTKIFCPTIKSRLQSALLFCRKEMDKSNLPWVSERQAASFLLCIIRFYLFLGILSGKYELLARIVERAERHKVSRVTNDSVVAYTRARASSPLKQKHFVIKIIIAQTRVREDCATELSLAFRIKTSGSRIVYIFFLHATKTIFNRKWKHLWFFYSAQLLDFR